MADSTDAAAYAIQGAASSFLSTLKSKFRTSQIAIDFVVKEVNSLTDLYLDFLKERISVNCAIQDGHLRLDQVFSELESLRGQSLFAGVETQPYLDSYIAHQSTDLPFGLKQLVFDWKVVYRRGIPHRVPAEYAYVVPFLQQLEQLLNCKDVLHCVDNPRPSPDGVFKTITDGYFYKAHFIVVRNGPKTLSIVIYVDDVQFADPCKSKKLKHKYRLFYWCLGNIYPELRSSLKAINLIGIVNYKVAKKYGNEEILKLFMKDIKALGDGVKLKINGEERLFHGILQFVAADIPAAANLGGFKESHFALRPCRMCMCTRFDICDHFREDENLLRRIDEHEKSVLQVEAKKLKTPLVTMVDVSLTSRQEVDTFEEEEEEREFIQDVRPAIVFNDHHDPSVNYGINARSPLAEAPGFDVTKCFPYDIMHGLWGGVGELLCRLLLKDMCTVPKQQVDASQPKQRRNVPAANPSHPKQQNKVPTVKPKVSLNYVNQVIQDFCDYGHLHQSRPSPIEKSHLESKLDQSASQMIVLLHILPVIAVNNISEEKQDLLGQFTKISAVSMLYEATEEDALELESLVEIFGKDFVRIYPEYKTLKLHALRHLAMMLRLHGPLRQQACFRYEAMHREFTRLVDIINNMINLEFSLITRHISARNNDIMNGKDDGTFLYSGDIVKKSEPTTLTALPDRDLILELLPELDLNVEVSTVDRFDRHGRSWKKDVIVSLQSNQEHAFGIIEKIYLVNDEIVFLYNNLKVNYLAKFHAFEIQRRDNVLKGILFSHIKLQFPVTRFTVHFRTNNVKSFLVSGSSGNLVG
ncbi:uncharacterized protein LOC117653807 [Thrips palmi]|uniref:Uncharacterized protein LOC117653807 n=1 Tax=Thrips palmi TaxID=161013 RepID=A0A6P9ABW1_THRPL|nr:uncharacterized protein LOC117653807 [Thrips palmi]